MKEKTRDFLLSFLVSAVTVLAACGLAYAVFAPRSAFSATTVTSATQWGDIRPTNSVGSVMEDAGFATTGYVHAVAHQALVALTNDFAENFTPLAAPIITSVVEDVLAPRTVDWYFDKTNLTGAAIMPNWVTSRVNIEVDQSWEESGTNMVGYLYASGKLRNYSCVIDSLPEHSGFLAFAVDSSIATNKNYTIYATPAMQDISELCGEPAFGWNVTSNDVPCVVTVRQPDKTTLIFSRDRLNTDDAYIKIEDGEPVLYTE